MILIQSLNRHVEIEQDRAPFVIADHALDPEERGHPGIFGHRTIT